MLLSYHFKNFLSFYDWVHFEMIPPASVVKKRFPDNYTTINKCDILKTSIIFGENAGGKSNFINSIGYLKSFFEKNDAVRSFRNTINNRCNSVINGGNCDTVQAFELSAVINGKIYLYKLVIDHLGIIQEELSSKTNIKQEFKSVFSATRSELIDPIEQKLTFLIIGNKNTKNIGIEPKSVGIGLFITKFAVVGDEDVLPFYEWVLNKLTPVSYDLNYSIVKEFRQEDEDLRVFQDPRFLEIFKLVDSSIERIEIDSEKPYRKSKVIRKRYDGSEFEVEIERDSSGVKEFFAWAIQIYGVIYENKTVFADEMDKVLNPVLSDRVISYINGNDHEGQFIFTTHNIYHMSLKKHMKEQLNIVTKERENLDSILYSISDFQDIRYDTPNIYELYMRGVFGGTAYE